MESVWNWLVSWFTKKEPEWTELDADEDLEMQKNLLLDLSLRKPEAK